ncbi:MAG: hypothetical protein WCO86_02865 [Planctomycetota bacterium]
MCRTDVASVLTNLTQDTPTSAVRHGIVAGCGHDKLLAEPKGNDVNFITPIDAVSAGYEGGTHVAGLLANDLESIERIVVASFHVADIDFVMNPE